VSDADAYFLAIWPANPDSGVGGRIGQGGVALGGQGVHSAGRRRQQFDPVDIKNVHFFHHDALQHHWPGLLQHDIMAVHQIARRDQGGGAFLRALARADQNGLICAKTQRLAKYSAVKSTHSNQLRTVSTVAIWQLPLSRDTSHCCARRSAAGQGPSRVKTI